MTSGMEPAAALSPHQGTEADRGSTVRLQRYTDGTRPKHVSEYSFLAPEEPVGNPAAAETQVHRDGHEATMGMGDQDERETEKGDQTRQRTPLARDITEDSDKERRPSKWQHMLNL